MYYWIQLKNASNDICLFHNCQPLWCTCRQVQQVLQATRVWNKGKYLGEPCSLVLFGAREIRSDGCSELMARVARCCSLDRCWQSLLRIPRYCEPKYLNPVKDVCISAWMFTSHHWLFKTAKQQWQHTWKINAFPRARIMCKPKLISGHCLVALSILFLLLPEVGAESLDPAKCQRSRCVFQQVLSAEPGQISRGVITIRCFFQFSVSLK